MVASYLDALAPVLSQVVEPAAVQVDRQGAFPRGAVDALGRAGLLGLVSAREEVARAQLEHAGIIGWFEQVLSADMVRRLKPAPEPYLLAGERLGVPVGQVRLIAAHAWDIAGAARAGCTTAFVARPGKVLDPLVDAPDVIGADLTEVTDRILAVDT